MRICNKCMHELEDGTKQCPYCGTWQYVKKTPKKELENAIVISCIVLLGIIVFFFWCYSKGAL